MAIAYSRLINWVKEEMLNVISDITFGLFITLVMEGHVCWSHCIVTLFLTYRKYAYSV